MKTPETTDERLDAIEERLNGSDVFSDKFWRRAVAITGHYIAVAFVVGAAFGAIGALLD